MTVAAQRGVRRQRLARAIFAVIVLAPVSFLFLSATRSADDAVAVGTKERYGLEYLAELAPLTRALAAAAGGPVGARRHQDVPVVAFDARNRISVRDTLLILLDEALVKARASR